MLKTCSYRERAAASRWCYRGALGVMVAVATFVVLTFQDFGITWDEELQSQYGQAVVDYYLSLFKDQRFDQIFNLYLYGGLFDGVASAVNRFTPTTVYETRHLLNAVVGMIGLWGTWRLSKLLGGSMGGLLALILLALTPIYLGPMFNNPKDIPFAAGLIWTLYYMAKGYALPLATVDSMKNRHCEEPKATWQSRVPQDRACDSGLPRRLRLLAMTAFARCVGVRKKAGLSARQRLLVKLGVVLGLTLGVRVGGAMVVAFWLAPWGLEALASLCHKLSKGRLLKLPHPNPPRKGEGNWLRNLRSLSRFPGCCWFVLRPYLVDVGLRFVLPVCAIAYLVMLVCWPWAQMNPIINPLRALGEFSNFPQDVEVLIAGEIRRSTQLPWYYVPLYFMVQLPEFLLALLGASVVALPFAARKMDRPRRQALLLLMLMAFAPILYAMARRPALYDAVRHFTFAVPLFCVFAALTITHIAAWGAERIRSPIGRRTTLIVAIMAGLLLAGNQIRIMAALHPYEYIYANAFAGGVKGIFGRYELDYWGSSFKETAEKIQSLVDSEGGVPPGQLTRIAICGPWDAAMIYLPPNFDPVEANKPAEFFLSTTRWMCHNMRPGREVIRVERMGAPLAIVKDLRPVDTIRKQ
ncbi:MAG: glycosyltransferase family 39 protein [Bdellovibrionales bacterium]